MALKPLNSVGGISVGETPSNVIAPNTYITSNGALFSGNVAISNAVASWGILTDNLYYSNGVPWDMQEAAGSNTQIQFNSNNNFGASANFTFDDAQNLLTLTGNANITNTLTTYQEKLTSATSTHIIYANGSSFLVGSANFTFNDSTNTLTVNGNAQFNNANLGNLATANFVNVASNVTSNNATINLELAGNTANFSGNVVIPNLKVNLELAGNTANFSSNIVANNVAVNLELSGNTANFSGNVIVPNLTVNLELAGNTANFSSNVQVNNLDVNLELSGNTANFSGNVIVPNLTVNLELQANTANFDGNVAMDSWLYVSNTANVGNLRTDNLLYANGNPWDLGGTPGGSNTQLQYNDGTGNFGASANLAFDYANNQLELNGDILLGGTQQNQIVNLSNTALEIRGGWNNTSSTSVNIVVGDYANSANWGKLAILGNYSGNSVGFSEANAFVFTNPGYGSGNVVKIDILNPTASSTTSGVIQANGGIGVTGDGYFGGNLSVTGNIANANNVSVTNALNGNTANFSGNLTAANANLGNLATANYVNVANDLNGNIANFSGNLTSLNANLGNLATANYINVANDLSVIGNVTAGNLIGDLANGNSNIRVYANSNIEVSIAGVANIATFSGNSLYLVGNVESTAGGMLANGNITANGFLNGANANVTGEVLAGSVKTANIIAPTGNITISAAGVDQDIILSPTGNGAVDVGLHKIVQVGDPTNPHDAATKEYVDNVAQGVFVHAPVVVTSVNNLNATYTDGGTALTTTDITGGKTIQFSANHGLSVGDEIYWTSSFNGITAYNAYFVYSTPALNQITVKDGFYGAEVTTLTNGTGLTQPALANSGVGATLTNAGANVALSIDGIALSATNRVLVQGQTNAYENGVYVVTTVGAPDSPGPGAQWVLTRSTDTDQYDPKSTTGFAIGDYFFVQQGTGYAGASYMVSSPTGEIVFGVTNIGFVQFSAAGAYSAGSGINIIGTTISANVDNDTTAIVGGNIVVKTSANLTTPNIGDATFQSITWSSNGNGNVTANNLSIGNLANITGNLTVGGNIQANYTISANGNVSGLNFTTNGNLEAGATVLANNVSANYTITAGNANVNNNTTTNSLTVNNAITGNTANFSGNVLVNNATVNLELAGNTANFSGNVILPNLTVNLDISGNTANFTGNISAGNANLGNSITANYLTLNNDGNVTGNLTANNFIGRLANGNSNVNIATANGNVTVSVAGNTDIVTITGTGVNVAGYVTATGNVTANVAIANNANIANSIQLGNTYNYWATVTTTAITANQTISTVPVSGITGVEWLVKGIDSLGTKYSVAMVTAVTDGSTTDYSTFGTVALGGTTGSLAVNIVGANIALQVTPASTNSTVWTTQYRTI